MFFFNHQAWVEGEGKVTFWWIQHGLAPICTSKFLFLHPKKWTKKKDFSLKYCRAPSMKNKPRGPQLWWWWLTSLTIHDLKKKKKNYTLPLLVGPWTELNLISRFSHTMFIQPRQSWLILPAVEHGRSRSARPCYGSSSRSKWVLIEYICIRVSWQNQNFNDSAMICGIPVDIN